MNRILALLGKNDLEKASRPGGSKPGGDDRTEAVPKAHR